MPDFVVTGASGFVGSRLCDVLVGFGATVRGCVREPRRSRVRGPAIEVVAVNDICDAVEWGRAFEKADCVVHLVARVHQLGETGPESLEGYRRTNVSGSVAALRGAARSGVRRFVFLSSVKVNGESASAKGPFLASDKPDPSDSYGLSKWEAEQSLLRESKELGIEIVILRPVLIYGPGVRANFLKLLDLVAAGVPLPLGAIDNHRSLLFLDNLCDLISVSSRHSAAVGETFLVSDGTPVSTPDLLTQIAFHMGKSPRVFPVPVGMLTSFGRLVGRADEIARLCDSLVVDTAKIRNMLDWEPPVSTDAGLRETVRWFMNRGSA